MKDQNKRRVTLGTYVTIRSWVLQPLFPTISIGLQSNPQRVSGSDNSVLLCFHITTYLNTSFNIFSQKVNWLCSDSARR